MRWWRTRAERERELDEEIRSHLEMAVRDRMAGGASRAEAERAARREFGDAGRVKEVTRTMWGGAWLDRAGRDLSHAWRGARRAPGFAVAVVLSLGLGIGATATVFAFADAILIRPLPYPEPDRLVTLRHDAPGVGVLEADQSEGTYLHYRAHNRAFTEIATYYENVVNLSGTDGADAERVPVAMVTSTFFDVLGARAAAGRLPTATTAAPVDGADEVGAETEAPRVVDVVLSHDLWRRRYGADPEIVGSMIEANRALRRVVAVAEPGFSYPRREIGLWYPGDPDPATARAADMYMEGIGRLRPGVSAAEAERDLDRLIPTLPDAFPDLAPEWIDQARLRARVLPLEDAIVGQASQVLWLLLAGMALLLVIACVNVANLQLVRSEALRHDVAMRRALGAGTADIVRHFAAESLLLSALGGATGLAFAAWGIAFLTGALPPESLPRLHEVGIDGRLVAFCAMLSSAVGFVFVGLPILRGEGSRVGALPSRRGSTASGSRARRVLVAGQVALALTLLIGSALLTRSFRRLQGVDPGFDPAGVLTAEISMPYRGYETYEVTERLWRDLVDRVRGMPGVVDVAVVTALPLVPMPAYYDVAVQVDGEQRIHSGLTLYDETPGYLSTMRMRLLEGRDVALTDDPAARPVLLSAAAARRIVPEGGATGRRLRLAVGPGPWLTVVGVVEDVPARRLGGAPMEVAYLPLVERQAVPQRSPGQGTLVVRADVPPVTLAPALRATLRALDPDLPLARVRPLEEIVSDSMARTTLTMILLVVASTGALFLGVVGVYGITSYAVGARTREIGLRVALGARPRDVERMVLRDGAAVVLVGVAVGIAASVGATRFMRALLFEVAPTDVVSYSAAALVLAGTALLATWLPARRAARVDPRDALRAD